MSLFAIVTPNLNQSLFLPDAFESLKHQSVPFNLAVMDGGSSDNFEDVVCQYKDLIAYIHSGPDGGQANAICKGISAVSGDIVAWLNADDYYFPGALDKVSEYFKKHPEIDVLYGDAVHVTPEGDFISYFPAIQEYDEKRLPRSCFICQPACFVRKSAYDAVGGVDPELRYTMDWDLWCRLAASGAKFKYLHEVLAAVRYYPGTKTLSGDCQRYIEIWRIGKKYGKQFFPFSWLGFYRFDLSFKKEKSRFEKMIFHLLECVRQMKKKLLKESEKTLYRFYRWKPPVDGKCLIQLPCYKNKKAEVLELKVSPENMEYQVDINSTFSAVCYAENGKLKISMPELSDCCLRIQVECCGRRQWLLLGFLLDKYHYADHHDLQPNAINLSIC